ncbi:serpin family protein [Thermomonospora sp. CIF 1]|uniref:serpin family protein n=1 Tax=Thermomonospora sp. CIF 1 TaxID=1916083 RepID=UPI000ADF8673|nr:serpin family protein [Thermomonospora sp. CIF 1]PKK14917.1 MAG: hypothetical protein BUE48_007090 [Thermomonospora sp. CIF 1]
MARGGPLIDAANALTVRWAAAVCSPAQSTVLSGAGVWPLLGLLAAGAAGPGERELRQAIGVTSGDPIDAAESLLEEMASAPAVQSALGLWTARGLRLNPQWAGRLPAGTRGELTGDPGRDQELLNAWARERTDGLIPAMPVEVDAATRLVLAGALAIRTTWDEPFSEFPTPLTDGPWGGRWIVALSRTVRTMHDLQVADTPGGPLTMLRVTGSGDLDVHLLLGGPARMPGDVLAAGVAALAGRCSLTGGDALPEGEPAPGVVVRTMESAVLGDVMNQMVPRFTVTSSHDLLATPQVFGLQSVMDTARGHFPGISAEPLAIDQARQNVRASFQARGFEAAAVTAFAATVGSAPPAATVKVKYVQVCFDRPFAFLAVHRTSGLILVAGWVAEADEAAVPGLPSPRPARPGRPFGRWGGS